VLGTSYVLAVVLGLFAGRAVWLAQHPESWSGAASLVTLQAGGVAPFAAVTAGLLVTALHLQRRKIPVLPWLDAVAIALAIGLVLERLGALCAGAGYGRYAPDLGFAIRFPAESPAFVDQRRTLEVLLKPGAAESLPVHPTQLYAVAVGVVALVVGLRLRKRRRWSGQVFIAVVAVIVAGRTFVEEWFRADRAGAVAGPFNAGQIAAVLLLLALVVAWRAGERRAAADPARARQWEGGPWTPKVGAEPERGGGG
jgi:phosphatidylglycerol:prolipoprotein diacylglycerol transferase